MSKHLYMHAGPVQEARRRLQLWVGFSRFFSVDEFRTSKTCSRCHGEVRARVQATAAAAHMGCHTLHWVRRRLEQGRERRS